MLATQAVNALAATTSLDGRFARRLLDTAGASLTRLRTPADRWLPKRIFNLLLELSLIKANRDMHRLHMQLMDERPVAFLDDAPLVRRKF